MATRTAKPKVTLAEDDIAKVRRALDIIQEAQNLVNAAAREICSVPGFSREWSDSRRPYEVVRDYWYKLNGRLEALRVPPVARPGVKLPPACPSCGCALPADGSCCDNCDWVKPQ